ncbi:hypothetical protein FZ611_05715 [Staphylococcus pseudintermedius]|nr:hypothetical protein [Staphylococcus pseudintermedius]
MKTMLDDPMIVWPKIPRLIRSCQYFIDNGVIVYGGSKGPFKLKGKKSIDITQKIFNLLEDNELLWDDLLIKIAKDIDRNYLIYILTLLNQNGYLISKCSMNSEEEYLEILNSNLNNYSSYKEIISNLYNNPIKVSTSIDELNEKFNNYMLNDDTGNYMYWELKQVKNKQDLKEINLNARTLLFSKKNDKLIIGPIISRDALLIEDIEEYYLKDSIKCDFTDSEIRQIFLIFKKLFSKTGAYDLNKGVYEITNENVIFKSLIELKDLSNDVIKKHQILSSFSAGKYNHKRSQFVHYKPSNVKLAVEEIDTNFFKEVNEIIPYPLQKMVQYLNGFKKDNFKKYTPTGGNINANIIYYINNKPEHLNGRGIYIFNNVKNKFYQIDNRIEHLKIAFEENFLLNNDGIILLGNDIDMIAKKYGHFGFNVANLNTGVMFATFMSLKNDVFLNDKITFSKSYEEKILKKRFGVPLSNMVINMCIGVKYHDK